MNVFLNVCSDENKQNSPQTQNNYMNAFWMLLKRNSQKSIDGFHQILEWLFSKKENSVCT